MQRLRKLIDEIHRRGLWQTLGIYGVASWLVLQVVDTLGGALNLPDGLDSVALALLILGLPIVLATGFLAGGAVGGGGRAREALDAPPGQAAAHASTGASDGRDEGQRRTWKHAATIFAALFVLAAGVAGWAVLRTDAPPQDFFVELRRRAPR